MMEAKGDNILHAFEINGSGFLGEVKSIIDAVIRKWQWCDAESVDDIAQDCFVKLLQNIRSGKFKGESSLKTYVYAIVRNTCLDYYRRRRAVELIDVEELDMADESPSVEEMIQLRDRRGLACRVLLQLPSECRKLWRAIFFGKRNYRQAADILGLTEGTVKRRMWECRQIAQENLKSLEAANLRQVCQTKRL